MRVHDKETFQKKLKYHKDIKQKAKILRLSGCLTTTLKLFKFFTLIIFLMCDLMKLKLI